MHKSTIGFIGGGNMATSLIGGLISDKHDANKLYVYDTDKEKSQSLQNCFHIHSCQSLQELAEQVSIIVLAVKPQMMHAVCNQLKKYSDPHKHLLLSVAAGIRISSLMLYPDMPVIRSMPNTPALIQCGATALYANEFTTRQHRDQAESLMRSVGLTLWLDNEDDMDAVTALSGSGPAYIFLLLESLQNAATALGLPAKTAELLALQTAFGASKMALESNENAASLRRRVTSPNGTTERAINILEAGGIHPLFHDALLGACQRSRELAHELSQTANDKID